MENQTELQIIIPTEFQSLAPEFTVDEKGIGYISGRALAKLAGVDESSIREPFKTMRGSLYNYSVNQLVNCGVTEKGYDDKLATVILTYYALESKVKSTQAARSLVKFAAVGLRVMIQKIVGWKETPVFKIPATYAEALRLAADQTERAEKAEAKIIELQPKAEYSDGVLKSEGGILVSKIAQDFGWSACKLNKELEKQGIQYKRRGTWLLKQPYADKGYTLSNTFLYNTKDGSTGTSHQMLWTEKGRHFIHCLFNSRYNIDSNNLQAAA